MSWRYTKQTGIALTARSYGRLCPASLSELGKGPESAGHRSASKAVAALIGQGWLVLVPGTDRFGSDDLYRITCPDWAWSLEPEAGQGAA